MENKKSESVHHAGILSVALAYPRRWMPNAYWEKEHAEMVQNAKELSINRIWRSDAKSDEKKNSPAKTFDEAMFAYVEDPFRGVQERRWLEPGQSPLEIEEQAARDAVSAAGLQIEDIDFLIVGSFFPDYLDTGNATFLAEKLGLEGGCFNLETACSSSVVGMQTAMALIDSGQYNRILLVNSCSYSRYAPATESISWINGDGAAAMVIGRSEKHGKWIGGHTQHTGATCGALTLLPELQEDEIVLRMRTSKNAGKMLRETAQPYLEKCVYTALEKAHMSLDDVDFFVCNTPTAWYKEFFCNALGIPQEKAISMHALVANVGPVLMPTNLFYALKKGEIKPGNRVLFFSIGSVSSASCAILEVGEIGLGKMPVEANAETVPGGLLPLE